jgi:predicted metal-binding membrane protein
MADAAVDLKPNARAVTGAGGPWLRSRTVALACVVTVSALGWVYCGLAAAGIAAARGAEALGPAMGAFAWLLNMPDGPAWWQALCSAPSASAVDPALAFALLAAMWLAMAAAMMLPTAYPMLTTYGELAETAARQGEAAASPLMLAAGYLAVWSGFAFAAAAAQWAASMAAPAALAPAGRWIAAAIVMGAGAYQFSALKQACLRVCQNPFRFFFANWTERASGVFRLGLRQGLYCLGCCWAAMLVMFAVGTMNVVWMAMLGALMTAEKLTAGPAFSRLIGIAFVSTGLAIALGFIV